MKQGGFSSEREANAALTDAMARLDRGVYVDRSKLAVGHYLDQWLEGRVNLRPASVIVYRVAVDRYLKPELGHLRLSDLRGDDIDRAFARILKGVDGRGNEVSDALIGRLKTTLCAALKIAVKRGLLHTTRCCTSRSLHIRPPCTCGTPRRPDGSSTRPPTARTALCGT